MSFDRERAELSQAQLDLAASVDAIIEGGEVSLADGFQVTDLLAHPELALPALAVVRAIAGAGGIAGTVVLLNGAQAALMNDNAVDWFGGDEKGDG